jgi:hypothetical protein
MRKVILFVLAAIPLVRTISRAPSPNVQWSCTGLNCTASQPLAVYASDFGGRQWMIKVGAVPETLAGKSFPNWGRRIFSYVAPGVLLPNHSISSYFVMDEFSHSYPSGAYTASIPVTWRAGGKWSGEHRSGFHCSYESYPYEYRPGKRMYARQQPRILIQPQGIFRSAQFCRRTTTVLACPIRPTLVPTKISVEL